MSALRIIAQDLDFLLRNKVVLRFQHSVYDKLFEEQGHIKGDAYSLSSPKEWFPVSDDKCRHFRDALHNKFTDQVFKFMYGHDHEGVKGALLLFKDVDKAHEPVTDKLYGPPFYPVGEGNTFTKDQLIGSVPVNGEVLSLPYEKKFTEQFYATAGQRFYNISDAFTQFKIELGKVRSAFAYDLADQVITVIKAAVSREAEHGITADFATMFPNRVPMNLKRFMERLEALRSSETSIEQTNVEDHILQTPGITPSFGFSDKSQNR